MAEVKIHADPRSYEPRNVFGMLSKRQAIAGAVIAVIIVPTVILNLRLGLDPISPLTVLAFIPCLAAGIFLTAPVHGLHAEKWLPIVIRSRRQPPCRVRCGPEVAFEVAEARPTLRQRAALRREARADARARRAESELTRIPSTEKSDK